MSNLAKFLMLFCIGTLLAAASVWLIGGKKLEFDTSATVSAVPGQIFPYLVTPDLKKKWMQGLVEQELVDASAIEEGTMSRSVVESNGYTDEFDDEVIRFAQDEILSIKSSSDRMHSTWFFRLNENDNKTELTYRRIILFKGIERFKSVFSRDDYQREIEDDLSRLIKLVESDAVNQQSSANGNATNQDAVPVTEETDNQNDASDMPADDEQLKSAETDSD